MRQEKKRKVEYMDTIDGARVEREVHEDLI
jgi:hypothetical protein